MGTVASAPPGQSIGPLSTLWQYANGRTASFPAIPGGKSAWVRPTHRGVQMLDRIHIPKKQRKYVFNKRFEIRYNTAFDQVILHCGDPTRDPEGITWMTTGLIEDLQAMHKLGFAYSFEAWENGQLVGGGFGVSIGSYLTVDSMFHLTDDASKSAYVQMLIGLRETGYTFVDVNEPSPFMARWGARWVPDWQFETLLRQSVGRPRLFLDGKTPPHLPWKMRIGLPARSIAAKIARKVKGPFRRLRGSAATIPSHPESFSDDSIGELTQETGA